MDVAESPDRDPRSPEDEEEEQQGLSDDDILRESGSEQDLDAAGGRASDLEDEESVAPGLSQEDEESRSDEDDRDSEAQELSRGPASPPRAEGDCASDLRDEASSVTRDLDEHELDYDEEVPEEPAPGAQEDDAEKAGPEDDEERGEGAPGEEGKVGVRTVEDKEPPEAAKEKRKEDDDGEIDDGEIDDDDLEEGEVKDPSDRKVRPRPTCRFFMKGNCTWGMNCRFIHPGVNDKGNYSLITKAEPFPPNGAPPLGPHPLMPANPWVFRIGHPVLKKATIRKEQEPDFEEKRFTVTIGEDEREFDKENEVFRDWNYRITRDVRDTALEPYADPYYDYEIERFWRGGQYENFRVQYTEAEPYHNYRVCRLRERERDRERERRQRERERERERERDKERQRRKEEWERERAKRDEKDRQHRDRDKEREKDKEKPKARSPQPPSRQAEPPKKETASTGPQVKRADEWKDPWRRSKSPKKKLGVSVSPSRARRRRKTSASSASASNSSRSSSRSSSYSGSGSSRSRSRSSSYSSYSSRSSRHSSFSGSRSRSRSFSSSPSPSPTPSPHRPARAKGEPAPPPTKGQAWPFDFWTSGHGPRFFSIGDMALPGSLSSFTFFTAPAIGPSQQTCRRERLEASRTWHMNRMATGMQGQGVCWALGSREERWCGLVIRCLLMTPPQDSTQAAASLEERLRGHFSLAGKSKKEDGVKVDKRKRDSSTQPPKPSRTPAGGRSSQQPTTPQQAPPGQPPAATFIAHKEIKLTLLNKATDKGSRKRYEPSDKDRQSPPPAKRANLSPDRGSRDRKSGGRVSSPKPERQRGQNSKAPSAPTDRKRPLSPQSKSSSKVTSVPGKASDTSTTATAGTKSGKASTLSRREELLKQLKAVEDAIARKRAKIPGKV
uniref:Zinc finger CCCH-type containing 18 n=1 Tax=Bos mutus grunniens TaxID=30521 RepID=A0A8C0AML0_BOSMU